jgi:uncharacterized protein YggL (DUF469 family)
MASHAERNRVTAPCFMLGFLVELEVDETISSGRHDALWQTFMGVVEERGLVADGGTGRKRWSYMLRSEASQASDMDRKAIQAWAESRVEIAAVRVGPLVDLDETG